MPDTLGTGAVGALTQHSLRDYALLADGHRAALVGPQGEVAWLCAPGFADDACLSGLLGGPGRFRLQPAAPAVWGGSYRRRGLIWTHRWLCDDGSIVECDDLLAHPGDPETAVLLRRVRVLTGSVTMTAGLELAAGFGEHRLTEVRRDDDGRWTGTSGQLRMRLTGLGDASAHRAGTAVRDEQGALVGRVHLHGGDTLDLMLEVGACVGPPPDVETTWSSTCASWERALPPLPGLRATRDADLSRAVLRGLTGPSGGMVAAVTTSLPERGRTGRYDYRYCWIRDQAMVGLSAVAAGDHALVDDAVRFVGDRLRTDGAKLMPAYTPHGDRVPDERWVDLPGYGGGGVRVGNHVNAQFQLDAFGEAMQLFAAAARVDRLDADGWKAAIIAADAAAQHWQDPGAGIWELTDQCWTQSRLSLVAGLRGLAEVSPGGASTTAWLALADEILAATAKDCVHPDGWWQRAPDDPRVDAALLLPVLRGAFRPTDPRADATLARVLTTLQEDGYVYRFRHDERALSDVEGAFLFCSFAAALAAHQLGDEMTAIRLFERARSACGPPGLFSEEFDVQQRQPTGNLPQAFVHGLLLECAAVLPA